MAVGRASGCGAPAACLPGKDEQRMRGVCYPEGPAYASVTTVGIGNEMSA